MVGDEDNLFADEEKTNGAPSSPPRPETAPVKHPFTSKDTISLSSRVDKAPSENSSMRVNPDESQSVASHDSGDVLMNQQGESGGSKADSKNGEDMDKIRNLWVSGLSATTKAADLKTVFSAYGKVAGAKIVTSSRAPGARCFGYVTMASPQEADACIDKLNKSELGGSLIMVEKATPDNGPHRRKDEHRERGKSASKTSDTRGTSSRRSDRREDNNRKSGSASRSSRAHHDRETSYSSRHNDLANRSATSHNRPHHDSHNSSSSSRSTDLKRDVRRSAGRPGGPDRDRRSGPILTLNQIKDQRKREQDREEERRRRDRDRRREEDDERRRKEAHRRQQEAEEKLRLEREELKRERERLEREKKEILELERERQRAERRRLERDKVELEKLKRSQSVAGSSSSNSRIDDRRIAPKRSAEERDSYHLDSKRDRRGRDDLSGSSNQPPSGRSYKYFMQILKIS